jgi:Raf kinase inhibitor-like YbhB/YbcL family protein
MTDAVSSTHAALPRAVRIVSLVLLLAWSVTAPGCGKREDDLTRRSSDVSIQLSSPAFREGETIPKQYTGDGEDTSPPLRWPEPPQGASSFTVVCDDPDAPRGTWTHWLLFNLPPDRRELDPGLPAAETLPGGAKQGKNDFGNLGYGGPAPPRGKPHRYFFHMYALDTTLDLPAGAGRKQLLDAMKGHVLAEGQLMGLYGR